MTDDIGGGDVGRELGDEPAPAWRDAPPDILSPIDETSPVSGHVPLATSTEAASLAPENDWSAAVANLFPVLRPVGTQGLRLVDVDRAQLVANARQAHTMPLLGDGPCGLVVAYALPATGFDVIVNGEHLLSWGVEPEAVHEAALANLGAWSATAGWTEEASGSRHVLSSDTGTGLDAARILLDGARAQLAAGLAGAGGTAPGGPRILVGLPERHLLMAVALRPEDLEFGALFREFVAERHDAADEPIDRRIFELVGDQLVEFVG